MDAIEADGTNTLGWIERQGDNTGLLVSVVIPLPDHRGQALRSIRSWAKEQSFPRDRYEVIVTTDGSGPELDAQVAALLSPWDRVIVDPASDEIQLYDLGARAARAGGAVHRAPLHGNAHLY